MQRLKPVDVVIAEGGWVGLAMAKEIAGRTPLSVVVLERGPARRLKDYAAGMDEVDYALRFRMMQKGRGRMSIRIHPTSRPTRWRCSPRLRGSWDIIRLLIRRPR